MDSISSTSSTTASLDHIIQAFHGASSSSVRDAIVAIINKSVRGRLCRLITHSATPMQTATIRDHLCLYMIPALSDMVVEYLPCDGCAACYSRVYELEFSPDHGFDAYFYAALQENEHPEPGSVNEERSLEQLVSDHPHIEWMSDCFTPMDRIEISTIPSKQLSHLGSADDRHWIPFSALASSKFCTCEMLGDDLGVEDLVHFLNHFLPHHLISPTSTREILEGVLRQD